MVKEQIFLETNKGNVDDKTDGTCCDISQTSKLSAVKIDIVEYGR